MSKQKLWETRLKNWRSSNVSGVQFCRDKNLTYSNFMRWKKKLTEDSPTGFVRVEEDDFLNFHVGDISLRVDRSISTKDLSRLIAASSLSQVC